MFLLHKKCSPGVPRMLVTVSSEGIISKSPHSSLYVIEFCNASACLFSCFVYVLLHGVITWLCRFIPTPSLNKVFWRCRKAGLSMTAQILQYIPRNMHTILLCFALLWLCNRSQWIHMKYLSIFIRVALLWLYSEVSLMDMGKSVNV